MNHNALRRHLTILFLLVSLISVAQIPNGYYNQANDKTGDALKVALHDIIKGHTTVSYSNLWDAFWSTDNKGDGVVWDMYSDVPGGTPPYTYQLGKVNAENTILKAIAIIASIRGQRAGLVA